MTPAPSTPSRALRALVVLSVLGLAACTSTGATGTPPASTAAGPSAEVLPSALPSASPSEAPTPSASEPPETTAPTAVPTSIDPCQLLPPAEASKLAGATFGKGDASTTDSNARLCAYGQQGVVVQVLVAVAPDAATAKAQEPAFKAQLEQGAAQAGLPDLKLTELPDFEPGVDAAILQGSAKVAGQSLTVIALYALKGAVLVAVSDISLGGTVASLDAMEAQARTTLARLP